jgi:hypothetical protein
MRWVRHVARIGERIGSYTVLVESVQRVAMGRTARGSNPDGASFSISFQTGPVSPPESCTMGTESPSRGVKLAGAWPLPPVHTWFAEIK